MGKAKKTSVKNIVKENNVKSVTVKSNTVKSNTSKNEVKLITEENFSNSVVKGGKCKDVKNELMNYLNSQFNALYITSANNIATFQLKVSDVIKQFLVVNDNKINASSYDLNAIIQDVIFEIASVYKNNGEKRIPCIKANANNVPILMTCDVSKFDYFYSKNVKSLESKEKAKKTREEKAKKASEEKENLTTENVCDGIKIDNAEKATTCIMLLIAKYGNKLDLNAIQETLDTYLKNANTDIIENIA